MPKQNKLTESLGHVSEADIDATVFKAVLFRLMVSA